jgi:hypothetical protein
LAGFDDITIIRSRRRTISLEITRDAGILIRAPVRVPKSYIRKFFTEKEDWVNRKIREISSRPTRPEREFKNGEKFLVLGEYYELEILSGSSAGISLGEKLYVGELRTREIRDLLIEWYRKKAIEIFPARVAGYSAILDYTPKKIRISDARRRWASCSTSGTLSFCWRLVLAPPEVIDYVIVHELSHMRQPDHSPRFWEKVRAAMPDYERRKQWLRENERLLEI